MAAFAFPSLPSMDSGVGGKPGMRGREGGKEPGLSKEEESAMMCDPALVAILTQS